MQTVDIYNLEFQDYITELTIGDYKFSRSPNYSDVYSQMMCLVKSSGGELNTDLRTGSHQITARVEIPNKEKKSTQLDDILLLLTLFTGRSVFKKDRDDSKPIVIIEDQRKHQFGGQLICSLETESMFKHKSAGELKTPEEMASIKVFHYNQINIGFEKELNKVLEKISSDEWQQNYEGGYFLLLFRSAMRRQMIESTFITCWTIWEHIFAIKNRKWLDETAIVQMSGDKKIAFILNDFFFKNIDDKARKEITRITKTRNHLIHFGMKTEQVDFDEMEMFIRLTEQLMAIILGLSPSNLFNSFERLEKFLKPKTK